MSKSEKFIVELEKGVWISNYSGDPGRTLVKESAKEFSSNVLANNALDKARQFPGRKFLNAKVLPIKKYRLVYNYDEAMKEILNGEEIHEIEDGEFERIASHEELETCHPHDDFYSQEIGYNIYIDAINNGNKALEL
jgi:hypothetical protein